jgi:hypothetical protein
VLYERLVYNKFEADLSTWNPEQSKKMSDKNYSAPGSDFKDESKDLRSKRREEVEIFHEDLYSTSLNQFQV